MVFGGRVGASTCSNHFTTNKGSTQGMELVHNNVVVVYYTQQVFNSGAAHQQSIFLCDQMDCMVSYTEISNQMETSAAFSVTRWMVVVYCTQISDQMETSASSVMRWKVVVSCTQRDF